MRVPLSNHDKKIIDLARYLGVLYAIHVKQVFCLVLQIFSWCYHFLVCYCSVVHLLGLVSSATTSTDETLDFGSGLWCSVVVCRWAPDMCTQAHTSVTKPKVRKISFWSWRSVEQWFSTTRIQIHGWLVLWTQERDTFSSSSKEYRILEPK